jgi:hypothetical protein
MADLEYDENAAKKENDKTSSLVWSTYWLKAIVFQGGRALEAQQQSLPHNNSSVYNGISRMEEQFFLTACQKARRWIEAMDLNTPEADQFSALGKRFEQIRGEREHDNDHSGLGKKRKYKDSQEVPIRRMGTSEGVKASVSAGVTSTVDGRLVLGGVVDIQEVIDAAGALMPQLIEQHNNNWDKRLTRNGDMTEQMANVAGSYYIEPRF